MQYAHVTLLPRMYRERGRVPVSCLHRTRAALSRGEIVASPDRAMQGRASAGPVSQQILDGITHFEDLAVEQMIGGVDDHELLWIGGARVELLHRFQRTQLVAFALDEELRL